MTNDFAEESMNALSDFSMAGLYLNLAMAFLMTKDAISAGLPALRQGEPLFRSDIDVIKSFPIFSFAFFCTVVPHHAQEPLHISFVDAESSLVPWPHLHARRWISLDDAPLN